MAHKYSDTERINWLKSLNTNFNKQNWHNDTVFHPSHIKHFSFFKKTETVKEFINPSKICGIEYAYAYNCPAYKPTNWRYQWLEFFTDLKRLDRVIDNFDTLQKVSDHIHYTEEPKLVHQYGDHYFTMGGQHRLCLAKFLEIPKVEVFVTKYTLDKELFKREMRFVKHIPQLIKEKFLTEKFSTESQYDFALLQISKNDSIYVKKRHIDYLLNRYEILKKMPFKGYYNVWRSFSIENYKRNHIDDDDLLYLLDAFLLKHKSSKF